MNLFSWHTKSASTEPEPLTLTLTLIGPSLDLRSVSTEPEIDMIRRLIHNQDTYSPVDSQAIEETNRHEHHDLTMTTLDSTLREGQLWGRSVRVRP